MLHLQQRAIPLSQLVTSASAIALAHPADPPQRVVQASTGGERPADQPQEPSVSYALVYDRFVVEEWLCAPDGAPAEIEVASPANEASARDAFDAAHGMLGHIHHVVEEPVLQDLPADWIPAGDGARLLFLAPTSLDSASPHFTHTFPGISLAPTAREAVVAALGAGGLRGSPTTTSSSTTARALVLVALAAVVLSLLLWGLLC